MKKLILFFTGILTAFLTIQAQNVGIGTNSPTEKLHISGDTRIETDGNKPIVFTSGNFGNGNSTDMYWNEGGVGFNQSEFIMYNQNNNNDVDRYFALFYSDGGDANGLNIRYNGSIGIGTTLADAKLDVTATDAGILIPRVTLTGTTDATTVPSATTSELVYNSATVSDVTPGYYYWNGSTWERILVSGDIDSDIDWLTLTDGTPTAIDDDIYTEGFVGIGSNTKMSNLALKVRSPASSLNYSWGDLNGHITAIFEGPSTNTSGAGGNFVSLVGSTNNTVGIWFSDKDDKNPGGVEYDHGDNEMSFITDDSEKMVLTSNGNLGIGSGATPWYTEAPTDNLEMRNGGGIRFHDGEIDSTSQNSGVLFFDEDYYDTGEVGDGDFNGDGGGLAVNSGDGWGAIVSTANMEFLEMDLSSLNIGGTTDPGDNNLLVIGNADVGGDADITGNADVGGDADITGNTTIGGTADITGNTSISGTATVTGNTTLTTLGGSGNALVLTDNVGFIIKCCAFQ